MRKSVLLVIVMLLSVFSSAYGQAEKNVVRRVYVEGFTYTPKKEKKNVGNVLGSIATTALTGKNTTQQTQYADAVRAAIVSGLSKVRLFNIVEDDFAVGSVEEVFYVDGVISNISTTSKTEPNSEKGKPDNQYYKSLVSVMVNLKDSHTGEVVDSHTFSISGGDGSWVSSAETAIDNSLKQLTAKVASHYNGKFPLSGSIIEAGESKKDKQKSVYIDLGTTIGVYKGQQFSVYTVKTIAGKEAKVEIGRIKIETVLGDELSNCKVTKGDKDLKSALDSGETLVVVSRN